MPTKFEHVLKEIDWQSDDLDDQLDDAIYTVLMSLKLNGGWTDNGIGQYEYWGAVGTHHDWCVEVEDAHTTILLKDFPELDIDDLVSYFYVVYSGGGCDEEHGGRCRRSCQEWDVSLKWDIEKHERVPEGLVVYLDGSYV